ncbi:hypothetical protein Mco01_15510 [Microbispora corallina]|uniref:Uncharacterized protein n=2 Tax=Streptosporangiaceae TaxID=2004 RepID=A0ABQ4FUQ2_9ACTN|nr:hypothetical protein MPTA5024_28305 [Microbispora sp. ATCC PTA-5024]GIH38551.1 hypothetical protein Mco01_15510 [Microbispora corallina]
MRRRAHELRECARRARSIAEGLGPCLDQAVSLATAKDAWQGWYAHEITGRLTDRQRGLRGMATQLVNDAGSWIAEADRLEQAADKAGKEAKAGR